jgi:hypothetical protein
MEGEPQGGPTTRAAGLGGSRLGELAPVSLGHQPVAHLLVGFARQGAALRRYAASVPIVLQKSFCNGDQKFCGS